MHGHVRIFYGYFGHVGIFDGYGYGKFLVVVSGHVKNFGCGKILVGHR